MRKAVECTFGVMKKRFRILRRDMECREPETIESTFKACCALHNILLRHDKLNTVGYNRADWVPAREVIDRCNIEGDRAKHTVRGPRNMSGTASQREAGHSILREELIAHYAHLCKRREVGWLRTGAEVRARPGFLEAEANAGIDLESEGEEPDLVSPDEDSDIPDEEE